MAGALRELLARFGIAVDTSQLDKADQKTDGFADKLSGLADAFTGSVLISGMRDFTRGLIEAGDQLKDQSERLGIDVEELQAWQFAAKQSGASAEEFGVGVKTLYKNLSESQAGGGLADDFAKLKIKIKDASGAAASATEIIPQLADRIADSKNPTEQAGLALKFFGKSGLALLPLLKEGAAGSKELLERFQELGGGYSKEFVEAADAAGDAQEELNVAWKGAKNQLGIVLIPIVTSVVGKITELVRTVTGAAKGTSAFKTILVTLGGGAVFTAVGSLASAASKFGLIGGAAGKAGPGILGLARNVATLGKAFVRTALPLIALFLLIDDLYALFNGGNSVIGRFIDGFFGVGTAATLVNMLKLGWQDFLVWVKKFGPLFGAVFEFVKIVLQDAFNGFKGTTGMFAEAWDLLMAQILKAWGEAWDSADAWLTSFLKSIVKQIDENPVLSALFAGTGVSGILSAVVNTREASAASEKGYLDRRQQFLAAQQASGNGGTKIEISAPINIDGAGNPETAAQKMQARLSAVSSDAARKLGALQRP